MNDTIRIGLAEDHVFIRQGLISLLKNNKNISIVFDVNNGVEVLEALKTSTPDIILLDIEMPEMNGIEALKQISIIYPEIKVIMLTMFFKNEFIVQCVRHGARAFLPKESSFEKIVEAINSVYHTGHYFDESVAEILAFEASRIDSCLLTNLKSKLTKRELEVFELLLQNKTNKEIAEILNISLRTIEGHRCSILHKSGQTSVTALISAITKDS